MLNQGIQFDHKNRLRDVALGQDIKMDSFRLTGGRGRSIGETIEKRKGKGDPTGFPRNPLRGGKYSNTGN